MVSESVPEAQRSNRRFLVRFCVRQIEPKGRHEDNQPRQQKNNGGEREQGGRIIFVQKYTAQVHAHTGGVHVGGYKIHRGQVDRREEHAESSSIFRDFERLSGRGDLRPDSDPI